MILVVPPPPVSVLPLMLSPRLRRDIVFNASVRLAAAASFCILCDTCAVYAAVFSLAVFFCFLVPVAFFWLSG